MREIHTTSREAEASFGKRLFEVAVDDHWMAALWQVKDGRIELVRCTTSNFPRGDCLAAVGHLALDRFTEGRESQGLPSDPLPKAEGIFPIPFSLRQVKKSVEERGDGDNESDQKKPFTPEKRL